MLRISYSTGVYKIMRGDQVIGQGRTLEKALSAAVNGQLPTEAIWFAAEVLREAMGPRRETHSQIATS